jgi:hypothetical protein
MWNFIGSISRRKLSWYDKHVFFINDDGNRELLGRWFLGLAALVYFGGNYYVFHLMK